MEADHRGWTATHSLDSFDCTLANLREVVFACLEAAGVRSVAEVGAEHGLFTSELLTWSERNGGGPIVAIDPAPRKRLRELAERHPELELVVETSHDALPRLELPDAVLLDGDHNYFTVHEELLAIDHQAGERALPLVLLHDIGWPLGRRDTYHDPDRIPAEHRRPFSEHGFLVPGDSGLAERGLYYERIATEEGGAGNGVLTAVEDFVAERDGLRLAVVPAFFGLGVVWHQRAPYADAVAELLEGLDGNPLLERLEANRALHLASSHFQMVQAARAGARAARQEAVLRRLLESSAFGIAERLSRLRQRLGIATWQSVVSKDDIRRALDDDS
jgi:hypothetical protein